MIAIRDCQLIISILVYMDHLNGNWLDYLQVGWLSFKAVKGCHFFYFPTFEHISRAAALEWAKISKNLKTLLQQASEFDTTQCDFYTQWKFAKDF